VAQHSAVVREELQRISRLVEDLMALARAEMDDFVVTVPMRVDRFFDDLELRLTGLGTTDVELRRPEPIEMVGDADRLAQALLNLIVNASVHTPPGTPIVVSARRDGSSVVFSVHDDGPGIDPAIRDRLFQPFVRGHGSGIHRSTGLGLAVVAAVVEAHRGTVRFDTGVHGTTIELRIPLGTDAPVGDPAADDETEAIPITPTPPIRFARPAPRRPRA
jgi:two-component system OmpR family sensor kinase